METKDLLNYWIKTSDNDYNTMLNLFNSKIIIGVYLLDILS
jgi:hypothetical protein